MGDSAEKTAAWSCVVCSSNLSHVRTLTAPLVFQVSVQHVSLFDDKVRIHRWEVAGTLDATTLGSEAAGRAQTCTFQGSGASKTPP